MSKARLDLALGTSGLRPRRNGKAFLDRLAPNYWWVRAIISIKRHPAGPASQFMRPIWGRSLAPTTRRAGGRRRLHPRAGQRFLGALSWAQVRRGREAHGHFANAFVRAALLKCGREKMREAHEVCRTTRETRPSLVRTPGELRWPPARGTHVATESGRSSAINVLNRSQPALVAVHPYVSEEVHFQNWPVRSLKTTRGAAGLLWGPMTKTSVSCELDLHGWPRLEKDSTSNEIRVSRWGG